MQVAILQHPPGLSAYVGEILNAWGLAFHKGVEEGAIASLHPNDTPVLVVPAGRWPGDTEQAVVDYARRGGAVVCFLPQNELARAAGIETRTPKATPARLRITERPAAGLAGEMLPIVGAAEEYGLQPRAARLAYLCYPDRYDGESAGIIETPLERGVVVALAFDLPRCVMLLRQGDPSHAEWMPPDDCVRAGYLAGNIGQRDSNWIPYADLLGRLLVDLIRHHLPAPSPLLGHLPAEFPGLILFSGDEDCAAVAATDAQFADVTAAGGRMNLYMIPEDTRANAADIQRFRGHHDLGPHPNLRPLDGRPMTERLREYERQIRFFREQYAITPRTIRNHCLTWAGYTEMAEVQEKAGLRMDANFLAGVVYNRIRSYSPYGSYGAAMPMRFTRPDGHLVNVFQQHMHVEDDVDFSNDVYSARYSPQQFQVIVQRVLDDLTGRFHMPFGVNFHPGAWALYSRPHGMELLRQAGQRGLPVWSYDQWSWFWDARDTWRFDELTWDGRQLKLHAAGSVGHEDLRLLLPVNYDGMMLKMVLRDGQALVSPPVTRYRESLVSVPLPKDKMEYTLVADYHER